MSSDDILIGLAFVAIFEGLVLALAPSRFGELLRQIDEIPVDTRRLIGASVAAAGALILWLLKG